MPEHGPLQREAKAKYKKLIWNFREIIILSSTRPVETSYGCYKTESFHCFWGLRGKRRRDRIRNEIFREAGIQNLLIELEEKWLQWFGFVRGMDTTGLPRRVLQYKFKGRGPIQQPRWFSQVLKPSAREERAGKKLKRSSCGKKQITDFWWVDLCKNTNSARRTYFERIQILQYG
jgi:hypothetical protein